MSENNDSPLVFRDRGALETQRKLGAEMRQVLNAFSAVVNGQGEGGKPDEEEMGKIISSMGVIEEMRHSLPTDPLDVERVLNIHSALVIAKGMVWSALSEVQQRQFFPDDVNFEFKDTEE